MNTPLRRDRVERLRRAGVYLVTEQALSRGRSSIDVAAAALRAGVGAIQVREKDSSTRDELRIARELRALTLAHGALLVVNDRVDVALAVDADGVHIGQEDLPLADARAILGEDALIGLSITDAAHLRFDDAADADYLGVGAVFPTGSKDDAALTGLDLLGAARRAVAAPVIAIGGITADNAALAIRAGADGVAVISAITAAPDPLAAAEALIVAVRAAAVPA